MEFLAPCVEKDLRRYPRHPVVGRGLVVFPDIAEEHVELTRYSAARSFITGCIALQGTQDLAPSSINVTGYFEKSMSRARTSPAPDRE